MDRLARREEVLGQAPAVVPGAFNAPAALTSILTENSLHGRILAASTPGRCAATKQRPDAQRPDAPADRTRSPSACLRRPLTRLRPLTLSRCTATARARRLWYAVQQDGG